MKLSIFGDIHQKYGQFFKKIEESQSTHILQAGDMGFDYKPLEIYNDDFFKFIGGNHDDYDQYYDCEYALGDYGTETLGPLDFFYIRGAFSIDKNYRIAYDKINGTKTWWEDEELDAQNREDAYNTYKLEKPEFVITHTCPTEIAQIIGDPKILDNFGLPRDFASNTQSLLQRCFVQHKPKIWIFGHFHQNLDFNYKGTRFICLDELSYLSIDDNGQIENKNKTLHLIHPKIENNECNI